MSVRERAFSWRGVHLWLFLAAACGFLLFQQGEITESDGTSVYQAARSMMSGRIDVAPEYGVRGVGGRYYSKYGPGLSLVVLLPMLAVQPIAGHAGGAFLEQAAAASVIPIVAALLLVALFELGIELGARKSASIGMAIGATAGTYALSYTKDFFSEPLVALFIALAMLMALRRKALLCGLAVSAAAITRPQFLLLMPVFAVLLAVTDRRGLPRLIAGMVPGVVMLAVYNWARFGTVTGTGYGAEGFGTPIWVGVAGLLASPAKSVILFAPVVVVLPWALARLRQARPEAFWMMCGVMAATVVTSATWHSWQGGWSWGPRLLLPGLLPVLPAVALWMDSAPKARAVLALCVLGALITLPAVIVSNQAQELDRPLPVDGPSIIRQFALIPGVISYTLHHARDGGPALTGVSRRFVNTWQVGAVRALGGKGLILGLVGTGLLAAGGIFSGRKVIDSMAPDAAPRREFARVQRVAS